ncbi:two-component sensor histidine kinase BarA [Ferrimonas gelatinilytica]|uniref:two-component sensor histidine kinase BarA n=1 Tax=Ferrimonas gelatinilytica TaxID=1255257 RepID=UPI003CD06093
MTKYSLRTWVLVLALAPTMLVGLILGGYFTSSRFSELETTLLRQGTNIIEPLAIACEYGLQAQNREYTKRLIDQVQRHNAGLIKTIAVFDNQNQVLVSSRYQRDFELLRMPENRDFQQGLLLEHYGDILVLRAPVIQEALPMGSEPGPRTQLGYVSIQLNKHEALLEQYRAAVVAFIVVLLGVQLNLLFTFRLLKNVTAPITEMVRAVAKIREGKLNTRLEGDLIGELDSLKRGINAMAASLAEYHDEMQQNIDQATSDLRETLEQIEIQNVELDIAKKRALEASRIKSEFLANMSHELRTPLNGVIGFTRQLLKTPLHDNQRDYLQTIERSATNLLSIINDILDFSKLEAGKMVLEKVPFALRDSVDETLQLLSGSAYDKGLELVVEIEEEVPDSLCGDILRIQQVLTNLLGNAIKFTEQGCVRLHLALADRTADRVILRGEVSDTGIGIAKEQQSMLFQAFGQADSSVTRRFGGTGLGLVITKRLVNQMEGQIGFTSEKEKGSTFWFTLSIEPSTFAIDTPLPAAPLQGTRVILLEPRRHSRHAVQQLLRQWQLPVQTIDNLGALPEQPTTEPAPVLLLNAQQLDESDELPPNYPQRVLMTEGNLAAHWQHLAREGACTLLSMPLSARRLYQSLLKPSAEKPAQTLPAPAADLPPSSQSSNERAPIRLLAVDDNPANLKLITTLLTEMAQNVDSARDGQAAVEKCCQHRYDAIFMDIQMPEMDGLQATAIIRRDSLNRHTPIIAVTAHTLADEQSRILAAGMDDCLTKPIDEQSLARTLKHWVRSPQESEGAVNWPLALSQAGGNPSLAKEMLAMLVDSIPETLAELDHAITMGENDALLRCVHKLHGATCYSGVPDLQKICAQIESSLKQGQEMEHLEPELMELQDQLNLVATAARPYLAA